MAKSPRAYTQAPPTARRVISLTAAQLEHSTPKLVLVPHNDSNACIFSHGDDLRKGRDSFLYLSSHPGLAIIPKYTEKRQVKEWTYIELGIGPEKFAVKAKVEGKFIRQSDGNMVFDVAHWQMEEQNNLSLINGRNDKETYAEGGGRDFIVNSKDNTISPMHAPQFVLGVATPRLVLVKKGDIRTCIFDNASQLKKRSTVAAPLTLSSHPGFGVSPLWSGHRVHHEWNYIELGISPIGSSQIIEATYDGDFITNSLDAKVFDVANWKYYENNHLVIISGKIRSATRTKNGGRSFLINSDGSISPVKAKEFVFGVEFSNLDVFSKGVEAPPIVEAQVVKSF
eukprot:g1230.t1